MTDKNNDPIWIDMLGGILLACFAFYQLFQHVFAPVLALGWSNLARALSSSSIEVNVIAFVVGMFLSIYLLAWTFRKLCSLSFKLSRMV